MAKRAKSETVCSGYGPDPGVVAYLRAIGARGGSARTAKKRVAVVKNLRKANAARKAKRGGK